jgi:hypothetical protein
MSAPTELGLWFLGRRNYLHGTTLYDAVIPRCRNGANLSFRMNRLIESDRVAVEEFDPERDEAGRFSATLVWDEGARQKALGVAALAPSPAPARQPFDEDAIVARAGFSGTTVATKAPANDSLIRNLVPLNKALLQRTLTPPSPGQWLFARLDLDRHPDTFDELRLTLRSTLGHAVVASSIEIDGRGAGTVMFSWRTK